MRKFNEWVSKKETDVNSELFQKHFKFQSLSDMFKAIYTTNDRKKNDDLVDIINSGVNNFKNEIENMFEEEKEIEKPNDIVDIVEKIIEFNNRTQSGQGLNILTPEQMFSRLPIFLAQLRAGNNS